MSESSDTAKIQFVYFNKERPFTLHVKVQGKWSDFM